MTSPPADNRRPDVRRLSAIMFTDIVGYSAITQRDESLALSLLDEHNKLLREVIAAHGGSVVKTVGDAFLAEFSSALDAVKAAMAAQTALRARNAIVAGEPIHIRIGIHLGDVVYRDDDVFGDGVNIAARVQSVAPAEGICISGDVAGQVENKIDAPLISLGTPKLKNIERPISVFEIQMPWTPNTGETKKERKKVERKWKSLLMALSAVLLVAVGAAWFMRTATIPPVQLSLAVLPFADLSQTRDQEYLGDGLAEEILNQLAQVQSLRLVGRTSSFSFKGKNEDLRIIGQKLGVANLLEGSVRKDGNQLRITAQLIRADDGTHLWSKTYAREFKDVFAVQDEIAKDVATALSVKLEVGVLTRAAGGTTNIEAYEKFLQARTAQAKADVANILASTQLLREAVALDPGFGVASVALVQNLYDVVGVSAARNIPASREIAEILARNKRLQPDAPWTLHVQAYDDLAYYRWADAGAVVEAVLKTPYGSRRVVDPWANPPIYLKWAWLFNVGRVAEAVQLADEWARTDPLSVYASNALLQQLPYAGRDVEVPAQYDRNKSLLAKNPWAEWMRLNQLLRDKDASTEAIKKQFIALGVDKMASDVLERKLFDSLGNPSAIRATLEAELAKPDAHRSYLAPAIYADAFGETDLALDAIRREVVSPAFRRPARLHFVLWYPYKSNLRRDARFKSILREAGLVEYWRKSGNWGDFCKPLGNDDFECR